MKTTAEILSALDLSPANAAEPFHIQVGKIGVTIFCPGPLRRELYAYFAEARTNTPGDIVVHLLPEQSLDPEPIWGNWSREFGKAGRKDGFCALEDGRLIRKLRSGVTFLQARGVAVAFGPIENNVSTVINFINTQILNTCLADGWQLCHAAAATGPNGGLAIAGLSGGGKSTSILRMMDIDGACFVSNDRLLIGSGHPLPALGIPKHPRINPGTILGNNRLGDLLGPKRRAELQAMPAEELWILEEKYDLNIGNVYGAGRIQYDTYLAEFWVLNWSRESTAPMTVTEVDIRQRPDLLGAIMKSPGPFYQHPDGSFEPNGSALNPEQYLKALNGLKICEVSGRIDFDTIAEQGRRVLDA